MRRATASAKGSIAWPHSYLCSLAFSLISRPPFARRRPTLGLTCMSGPQCSVGRVGVRERGAPYAVERARLGICARTGSVAASRKSSWTGSNFVNALSSRSEASAEGSRRRILNSPARRISMPMTEDRREGSMRRLDLEFTHTGKKPIKKKRVA